MKLFAEKGLKLQPLKNADFKLEKDIQKLVEQNLDELFGLEFVKSELPIKAFRIDTLCFSRENNAFVIIEYKKDRNFSIIDQGYTYMSLIINNKADFILEYNENKKKTIKRDDVDWSQSRVIFISPNFTEYQKHSVNFKDVPFELWEIKKYENNLVGFLQHKPDSNVSITTIETKGSGIVKEVSKAVQVYTEDMHLNHPKVSEITKERYLLLRERILSLGPDVKIVPRKMYVGFRKERSFFDVYIGKDYLWTWLNLKKGTIDDPKKICRDVSKIGHYGNGDYELTVRKDTDLDYVMFLVKQSFNKK